MQMVGLGPQGLSCWLVAAQGQVAWLIRRRYAIRDRGDDEYQPLHYAEVEKRG